MEPNKPESEPASGSWVDPRHAPKPPAQPARAAPVTDVREILELLASCRAGRIYEIERWIMAGKPLQATKYDVHKQGRLESPMEIAVGKGLFDVALLLLCNGYRLELDSNPPFGNPLDHALQSRSWDLVELLLEWGANPREIDPESVFGTYRVDLMDRFWDAGLDFAANHALAWHLSEHSSNRPLYGWAKRHIAEPRIARELDIALLHAVDQKREKVAHLLLWAGANPRARVPLLQWISRSGQEDDDDCYSAIEHAVAYERESMLAILKPDPARDDFATLYADADNVRALKLLLALQPPSDWTRAILNALRRLHHQLAYGPYGGRDARDCLDFIAKNGGRLGPISPKECADVRACLLKLDDSEFQKLLRWLDDPECCEPATYAEIARTSTIKARTRRIEREREKQRRGW